MPSPVSAEMAAEIRGNDEDFDDATVISSDFTGFKIPKTNGTNESPGPNSASPTPVPDDTYDPKKLSAKDSAGSAKVEVSSKVTRETPVIVSKEAGAAPAPAPAKVPARTTPAIIRTKPRAGSSATVETPKLIAEELSARLAAPTPPPDSSPRLSEPPQAKGRNMTGIIVAVVLLVGAGIGAVLLLTGGDSIEKIEEPAVVITKPADDSVGNLIKKADEKFVAGELIGDGGALSLLVAARVASPEDERVSLRLGPLADKFQELGDASFTAGDIVEAAAHYKNSLEADPARDEVAKKLAAIKTEIENAEDGSK